MESDGKGGAAKSKNEMGEGIKLVTSPDLIGLERSGYKQMQAGNLVNVGKFYDLAITITTESYPGELFGMFVGRSGYVLMMGYKVMQKKPGSDTEAKDQQQHSAQDSPYRGSLQQIL